MIKLFNLEVIKPHAPFIRQRTLIFFLKKLFTYSSRDCSKSSRLKITNDRRCYVLKIKQWRKSSFLYLYDIHERTSV